VKAKAFAEAMERLLAANKIKVIREGSPARYRDRIAEVLFGPLQRGPAVA
jgi:hypothetical protein